MADSVDIPSKPCNELMKDAENVKMSQEEGESILHELFNSDFMICPDLSEYDYKFKIQGETWANYSLGLAIWNNRGIDDGVLANTIIFSEDIVRYFEPEYYQEHGYQGAVTLTQNVVFPIAGSTKTI